jgi:hypothetical protein
MQNHSFALPFAPRCKGADYKKGAHQPKGRVYLVGFCISFSNGGLLKPRRFFCHTIPRPKQVDSVLPRVLLRSSLLSDVPPAACTVFWLVVVCIHLMAAHYGKGSTHLSIFIYWLLNSTPQTMVTPHVPPQLHHLPLPPPTLSFGWLSHSFIKWRPPKVEAPPTSLFFDQFCFGAPDKGTSCSGHKPGHRAPEVDSWEATAS